MFARKSTWIGAGMVAGILLAGSVSGIEISYDDGVAQAGSGHAFQGVRFSLPGGMMSARLVTVRYQYANSSASLTIHFTQDDHLTALAPPMAHTNSAPLWEEVDVSASNIIVPQNFYVVLAWTGLNSNPVTDIANDAGRSFGGSSLANLTNSLSGDLLLRVGVVDVASIFFDGFESGDTAKWSATVP